MYNDIDSGGGYYRNPYASGYGMGYQDPYGGMRYMPQRGLMGPSGFGGKGGYSQPMYSPYQYSPYGGMSPGKGGYGTTQDRRSPDDYLEMPTEESPPAETAVVEQAPETPIQPPVYQPMYQPMYPMMRQPMYPMYGGKGGYYR